MDACLWDNTLHAQKRECYTRDLRSAIVQSLIRSRTWHGSLTRYNVYEERFVTMRKGTGLLDLLEVTSRADWRRWLRKNHQSANEIWLVYHKKDSGKPRIPYNDAVEEALCFGWIDSTVRSLDAQRFAQKFSPRKPGSAYSPANIERLRKLIASGRVSKDVLVTIGKLPTARLVVAEDILDAIKANKLAWENYRKLSPAYKRIRIGFIEGARNRPPEFKKRLNYFIKMTAQNKQFGFGGIEKYY
jgi:uncharacterized protein YdeI (YjbR/CyaY-like superfamily)